jgi:hypothetical protein
LAFDYFFLGPKCHLWIEPSSYPPFAAFLGAVLPATVSIEAGGRVEEAFRQIDAKMVGMTQCSRSKAAGCDRRPRSSRGHINYNDRRVVELLGPG